MFSGVLPTQPWWEATPLCSALAPYFKILPGRSFLTLIGLDLRERIEMGRGEAGGLCGGSQCLWRQWLSWNLLGIWAHEAGIDKTKDGHPLGLYCTGMEVE